MLCTVFLYKEQHVLAHGFLKLLFSHQDIMLHSLDDLNFISLFSCLLDCLYFAIIFH